MTKETRPAFRPARTGKGRAKSHRGSDRFPACRLFAIVGQSLALAHTTSVDLGLRSGNQRPPFSRYSPQQCSPYVRFA
jgi:hypothetical protein